MITNITKQTEQQLPAAIAVSLPSCARTNQTVDMFAGLVARGRHAGVCDAVRRSGSFSWNRHSSVTD